MMKVENIILENRFKKWLLLIVLSLNVFTFSGYAGSFRIKRQPGKQIELLFRVVTNIKRTISYKSAFLFHAKNITADFSEPESRKALRIFNIIVGTRIALIQVQKRIFSFNHPHQFYQLKAFTPNPDEELPYSLRG
jgi:hypothetical protein